MANILIQDATWRPTSFSGLIVYLKISSIPRSLVFIFVNPVTDENLRDK